MPGTARAKKGNEELYAFDARMRERFGVVCGVDEAGRGPLCGPVCCAAVILDPQDRGGQRLQKTQREAARSLV